MTISHWARQHSFKSPDITTDILIVGGGFAGLSTAYWLTEMRTDQKITILERKQSGEGASGRNAGFLTKGSASFYKSLFQDWGAEKALGIYKFAEESVQLAHQKILKASPEVKSERTTSVTLFRNEERFKQWNNAEFPAQEFGFNWLERERLPQDLQGPFFGAYENGPEYKVHPLQMINSLKKSLESRKVQIIENVSAFKLHADGVSTEVNEIKAKRVILALNGYLPQFHSAFQGIITPRRAQMLAVDLDQSFDCPSLYYDPEERVYWRRVQDNILLIGGKRLLDETGELGDFEKISPKIQEGLESYLKMMGLKYRVLHRWSGIMGFTEHELPYVTKVNAPIEAFTLGGFSGHGMGLGFLSGKEMAELVNGVKQESFFSQFKKVDLTL